MIKKKQYYYLVSFMHDRGSGNGMMITDYKIKTFSDIKKLQSTIIDNNDVKSVCVTNFIRMKGE